MLELTVLTVEKHAGVVDAQPVGGHTCVVPIILFCDVGYQQESTGPHHLDAETLAVR